MPVNVPTIVSSSGNATVAAAGRQLLVENTDTVNAITVKINGSTTGWRLEAGSRLGIRLDGGIVTVQITAVAGSPTWQLLVG